MINSTIRIGRFVDGHAACEREHKGFTVFCATATFTPRLRSKASTEEVLATAEERNSSSFIITSAMKIFCIPAVCARPIKKFYPYSTSDSRDFAQNKLRLAKVFYEAAVLYDFLIKFLLK